MGRAPRQHVYHSDYATYAGIIRAGEPPRVWARDAHEPDSRKRTAGVLLAPEPNPANHCMPHFELRGQLRTRQAPTWILPQYFGRILHHLSSDHNRVDTRNQHAISRQSPHVALELHQASVSTAVQNIDIVVPKIGKDRISQAAAVGSPNCCVAYFDHTGDQHALSIL